MAERFFTDGDIETGVERKETPVLDDDMPVNELNDPVAAEVAMSAWSSLGGVAVDTLLDPTTPEMKDGNIHA